MNTALVSLQEYLDTEYSPDREYVDGVVVERHVGERPHSKVQKNLVAAFDRRYPKLDVWPEQRVRTVDARWRTPDVCVTLEDPGTDVFEAAPFVCIEILSRSDNVSDLLEKLEEYAALGVPNIWVIDPHRRKAFTYEDRSLREVTSPELTSNDPALTIPLAEVFLRL